jgi:hypothetical protein
MLNFTMMYEYNPGQFDAAFAKLPEAETKEILDKRLNFKDEYQLWYSEALALVRQLLPDRLADFVRHYEKPRGRKDIDFENYRIEDYLQGLFIVRGSEKVVDTSAAFPHFQQQLAIVKAARSRFESSLFEIRQILHADLLDSEIEAAEILAKHRFTRAAGALAGVVLERYLAQVCANHHLTIGKKNPTISIFNDSLRDASAIDLPQWRFIQHWGDIRNLCDHGRSPEPTAEQVEDLLLGVRKVIKTVH